MRARCGCSAGAASSRLGERDALLLLALLLLLRCMLDTWDTGYYMLPFLLALFSWEICGESRRPPVLALVAAVLPWIALHKLSADGLSPDAQAAIFLVWTVPLSVVLGLRLYAPAFTRRRLAQLERAAPAAATQEMTVSSFGRPVRSS